MSNTNNKTYDILDRVVDCEPTGVVYTIKGSMVEEFADDYFAAKGITDYDRMELYEINGFAAFYMILPFGSQHITPKNNVPEGLKDKIDDEGYKFSEKFYNIVSKFFEYDHRNRLICEKKADGYYLKINIFTMLGIMFAADVRRHQIAITSIRQDVDSFHDTIINVVKAEQVKNKKKDKDKNRSNNSRENILSIERSLRR